MRRPESIFRRRSCTAAMLFIIILPLAAVLSCRGEPDAPQAFVREAPASDHAGAEVLIARGDWSYPPFEFVNDRNEPDGFTVEIIRSIAEVMNLNIRIELGPWQEVRGQLEAGEIDIITGMYRTPERDRLLDFTVPHFIASYALFVRDEISIDELDDLPGHRIIVQAGDLAHDFLLSEGYGSDLVTVDEWQELLPAVAEGRADVTLMAMGQGMYERRKQGLGNIRMIGRPVLQQPYCVAVPANRPELLATLNEGLAILKANGSYERIYDRWFGVYENRGGLSPDTWRIVHAAAVLLLFILIVIWFWSVSLRNQVRRKTEQLREELEKQERTQEELQRAIEQVRSERNRAEEADAAKTRFLASVSHELRTPLHGIMGMTELLGRTALDGEQEELTGMIAASAQQLLRVLSDLLEVNRITTGSFSVRRTSFRLGELAGWLRPLLLQQARMRKLHFTLEAEDDGLPMRTDKERIAQVIINLADNAIKYTDHGSVRVLLRQHGDRLTIETADTGHGIPDDEQQRIFEPYYQLAADSDGRNGLGLGLAVVRSVVEQLEGSIELESGPGGTTFRVIIPVGTENRSAGEILPSGGESETMTVTDDAAGSGDSDGRPFLPHRTVIRGGLRILIAEDEAISRIYLARLLAGLGQNCEQVGNGEAALERLTGEQFDLALIDLSMPRMDGLEVSRRSRERGCTTPLIALTAHASVLYQERCLEAGMSGFVSKPFVEGELLQEIARVLETDAASGSDTMREPTGPVYG